MSLEALTRKTDLTNDYLKLINERLKNADEQQIVLAEKLNRLNKTFDRIAEYLKPISEAYAQTEEDRIMSLLVRLDTFRMMEEFGVLSATDKIKRKLTMVQLAEMLAKREVKQ